MCLSNVAGLSLGERGESEVTKTAQATCNVTRDKQDVMRQDETRLQTRQGIRGRQNQPTYNTSVTAEPDREALEANVAGMPGGIVRR